MVRKHFTSFALLSSKTTASFYIFLLSLNVIFCPFAASANPKALPYSYGYETLPEGNVEVEQYVDLTPVKALQANSGAPVFLANTQFQTEFEYGITNRLELGLYLTIAPPAGEGYLQAPQMVESNGLKQRLRYRFAEEGEWPIDVGIYGELVENQREIEIEGKILLHKRFGKFRAIANLWAEREFYFNGQREWVLNPTLGGTYEVTQKYHLGVESWMRAEFLDATGSGQQRAAFNLGPHVYAGPTFMCNFGKFWWSTGLYVRATHFGRSLNPGDSFGSVWMRSVVGIDL